eukprot:11138632-Alexandrium_andersonii.AAC.1
MESLFTRSTLASSMRSAYHRSCSLLQGCPLSTGWLSMLATKLVEAVHIAGGVPRILADDVTVTTSGRGHWAKLRACAF